MLQLALAAAALLGGDPSIAQHNAREIAQARAAVAEMTRLAVTADEKALAAHDRQVVEQMVELLAKRDRKHGAMAVPAAGAGAGAGAAGGLGSEPIGTAAGGDSQGELEAATKQMQETQMSFNLQYLQLQSQMQQENRSYSAVSNIMKTKHDTVKNSISNIR